MDWSELGDTMVTAAATIVIMATVGQGLAEIVKQVMTAMGKKLSAQWSRLIAGIAAAGLTALALIGQGIAWPIAVAAAVAAYPAAEGVYNRLAADRRAVQGGEAGGDSAERAQ